MTKPFSIHRRKLKITVSIGISCFPEDGSDTEMLLRAADYAMYLAKRSGKDTWSTNAPGRSRAGTPAAD